MKNQQVQPRQISFDPYGSVCLSLDRPHQAGAKLGPVESTVVLQLISKKSCFKLIAAA